MNFDGPIPGESLTDSPKKYPWERPPETVDEDQAIVHHLERFSQPKVEDNILDAIELGMPIAYIVDLALTGAVASGIHNIDMSLIIAPVLHEYLVGVAEASGMPYKEFFDEDPKDRTSSVKIKATEMLSKAIDTADEDDEGTNLLRELRDSVEETEPSTETPEQGLVPRRDKV